MSVKYWAYSDATNQDDCIPAGCDECGHLDACMMGIVTKGDPVTARWKHRHDGVYCTLCGKRNLLNVETAYCPHCGARMKGVEDEED